MLAFVTVARGLGIFVAVSCNPPARDFFESDAMSALRGEGSVEGGGREQTAFSARSPVQMWLDEK